MALHQQLPIYKVAYDLFNLVTDLVRNMPRDFKQSIGAEINRECLRVVVLIARANSARDKAPYSEEYLELDGLSDSGWRERIGNAVPPSAAAAIAGVMGTTLLLAWSGETFMLSASPIWVRPVAVALSVAQGGAT